MNNMSSLSPEQQQSQPPAASIISRPHLGTSNGTLSHHPPLNDNHQYDLDNHFHVNGYSASEETASPWKKLLTMIKSGTGSSKTPSYNPYSNYTARYL